MKMAFNHVSGITQDIYDQPEVRVLSTRILGSTKHFIIHVERLLNSFADVNLPDGGYKNLKTT